MPSGLEDRLPSNSQIPLKLSGSYMNRKIEWMIEMDIIDGPEASELFGLFQRVMTADVDELPRFTLRYTPFGDKLPAIIEGCRIRIELIGHDDDSGNSLHLMGYLLDYDPHGQISITGAYDATAKKGTIALGTMFSMASKEAPSPSSNDDM